MVGGLATQSIRDRGSESPWDGKEIWSGRPLGVLWGNALLSERTCRGGFKADEAWCVRRCVPEPKSLGFKVVGEIPEFISHILTPEVHSFSPCIFLTHPHPLFLFWWVSLFLLTLQSFSPLWKLLLCGHLSVLLSTCCCSLFRHHGELPDLPNKGVGLPPCL